MSSKDTHGTHGWGTTMARVERQVAFSEMQTAGVSLS